MAFFEVVDQARSLLAQRQRVAYRSLQREFDLDDSALEALKAELITAQGVAKDEDGLVLVWLGRADQTEPDGGHSRPSTPEAERRQLTVMFCDLVGSTALSERLDPEDLREVIRAYQELCAGVIRRFDGYIAQYLGDGLLVYFGYPRAHEDEPLRAVWTGLGIVEALPQLAFPHLPFPLRVRIGIHTGRVVVGEVGVEGRVEQLAIGEAPNIAARLQTLAEPDSVLISATTHRLVQRVFDCQDRGSHSLKGISAALHAYRVVGEHPSRTRFAFASDVMGSGKTPTLVGRDTAVAFLRERWERAARGAGQLVLLSGGAGIGKSRLVQAVSRQLEPDEVTRITVRCSPYDQNSALAPLIDLLERALSFEPSDTGPTRLAKLEQALARYRSPDAETLALFASLLALPLPDSVPTLRLSPQRQKQKIIQAVVSLLLEEAEIQPVYCVWEDLHWADPSTLEFFSAYLDRLPHSRSLVVGVFRPDFSPPWEAGPFLHALSLDRLSPAQVEELALRVCDGKPLPPAVLHQIRSRTDGVPLFVEELTRMYIESGIIREADGHYELTGPLPSLGIPTTLQDSLEARLDRLAVGKETAQLGATLGREFSYALIQTVSPLAEDRLQAELAGLVDADLLSPDGFPPQAHYTFRQTLIQESAYQSLLKSRRQAYHRQIALALEDRFPETVQTRPELIAHHYTAAGLAEPAIAYWQRAGQRATERSANAEATRHLTTGLELLDTLPDSVQRRQQELSLRIDLGTPLTATRGYTAPEVKALYTRTLELCRALGETPQLFVVVFGLWRFYLVAGNLGIARELAEQCWRQAESIGTPGALLTAHLSLGLTLNASGELAAAQEHLERSLRFYDPERHRPDRPEGAHFGQDPQIMSLALLANFLWLRGYPDQALARSQQAQQAADDLAHPFSSVFALEFVGTVHRFRGEYAAAHEYARALIDLAREQDFAFWVSLGQLAHGWALTDQGRVEEGVGLVERAITALHTIGPHQQRSSIFCLGAEAYRKGDQPAQGLAILEQAIAHIDQAGAGSQQADVFRLKGELLLEQAAQDGRLANGQRDAPPAPVVEAEACFQRAISIAQRDGTKSLELRATISLSRLWKDQERTDAARRRLADIYDWFTEGFDTADLRQARNLLTQLGQ